MKMIKILPLICLILLLFHGIGLAMSSTSYQIDWFEMLAGSSGPHMSSTNFHIEATLGQTAVQDASSPSAHVQMGFWSFLVMINLFLPIILRQ